MVLLNFASEEQSLMDKSRHSRSDLWGPFAFSSIAKGNPNLSPETYTHNFLKCMLQYIIEQYELAIKYFEDNIDLRISFAYVLNDLALYKNDALTTAEFCSTLKWNFRQGIAINRL